MIERELQAVTGSERNQPAGDFWRHGLPFFVVPDVPLGASKAIGQRLLGQSQALPDRFEVVHPSIMSPTDN